MVCSSYSRATIITIMNARSRNPALLTLSQVRAGAARGKSEARAFTAYAARVAHFVYGVFESDVATFYAIDATGETFDTFQLAL